MGTLERILDTRIEEDLALLLKVAAINPRYSVDQVERGLRIIASQLTEDWAVITPWEDLGVVSLRTAEKMSVAGGVNRVLVPLAIALDCLADIDNYPNLIKKLRITGHEKQSAVLEAVAAANYRLAGHEIELEPPTNNGKQCDFRVRWDNRWIYFECKKENFGESSYRKRLASYAAELAQTIEKSLAIPDHQCLHISLPKQRIPRIGRKLIETLRSILSGGKPGDKVQFEGAQVVLESRGVEVPLSSGYARYSQAKVGTTPTSLLQGTYIQITYPVCGTREIKRVRDSLREARTQLPKDSLGMILYDVQHTEMLRPEVQRVIGNSSFNHVMGVMLMGNGAWLVRNPLFSSLPLEFAKHGVVPPI